MQRVLMPSAVIAALVLCASSAFAATCESMVGVALQKSAIASAKSVPAGDFTPPQGKAIENLPAFCEVHGILKPTDASVIHFEVWLPVSNWNGKFEGVGNGGLAGTISYAAMATALRRGYATASTDTGHTATEPREWLENRERLVDYSYRGLHLATAAAKTIVDSFYGRNPAYSYFAGCSKGGQQALIEAQRFPADYDGIVAGDAGNFWTHQMASEVWNGVATSSPGANLSQEKLRLVQDAVMAACDAQDGIADGIISDPQRCHFDPQTLLCKGADGPGCLTAAQAAAVEKLYSGPVNPRTGKTIYPGFYPGGELGWGKEGGQMVINRTTSSGVSSNDFFRYALFRNPDWAFRSFDFDRDMQAADEKLGPVMNATDPNLAEFRKLGHKIIYYHGAADPLIPAQNGIDYYEKVVAADKGLDRTQEYFRAFLAPGLYHCAGGPGPTAFGAALPAPESQMDAEHDILSSLDRWVEKGVAPAKIIATKYVDNTPAKGIALQRPLCAYPEVARYKGSGDPNDASNFTCAK